jgi:hypothetical protein
MPSKCKTPNCTKRASYGLFGGSASSCSIHKTKDMINLDRKWCGHTNCTIYPVFGFPNRPDRYCITHKLAGMIDIASKKCKESGCSINPVFGLPGSIAKYCSIHKTSDMIDLVHPRCIEKGCEKYPLFNYPGKTEEYCILHKLDGMINIKSKPCIVDECNVRASYNYPNCSAEYCTLHKKKDMINVRVPYCNEPGCNTMRPPFDFPNGVGKFCKKHRKPDMVNVRGTQCAYEGCPVIQPTFNYPQNSKKGKYCSLHKLDGMVNVCTTQCRMENCIKNPSYAFPTDTSPIYCLTHKENGMINIKKRRLCDIDNCNTRVLYGYPGQIETHCGKHKQPGMLQRSNGKCKNHMCIDRAVYGSSNYIPIHCDLHKLESDLNLLERECVNCGLTMVLDKDNHCEYCHPLTFKTFALAKQNAIMNYLDTRTELPIPLSTDKIVDSGICGKERPDRIYDLGDKIIIIECDEHQHRERACECEQTRMINIGQMFGGIPVYFIRWNPDNYISEDELIQPEEINKRHKLLGDLLRDIVHNRISLPIALTSALYLYYDGWSGLYNEEWKILLPLIANGGAGRDTSISTPIRRKRPTIAND